MDYLETKTLDIMTIRLREASHPVIDYFSQMPKELVCDILTKCELKGHHLIAPQYLLSIENVCRVWRSFMPDILCALLNRGEVRLTHIPFISKKKKSPTVQPFYICQYLKFLNAKVSLEEINKLACNHFYIGSKKGTFQFRKMTYLNLTDLCHVDALMIMRLEPFFQNFETVVRPQCSLRDNNILPKFTQVKYLNISPNYNADLTFLPTLKKLENLTLHFINSDLFFKALLSIPQCTSISTLTMSTSTSFFPDFTDEFRVPDQVKELSLRMVNFTTNIFNGSSQVKSLDLKNIYLSLPLYFGNLKELKRLSIAIREIITDLNIIDLSLDYLNLSSDSLKNLTFTNCDIKKFEYDLLSLENTIYDDTPT